MRKLSDITRKTLGRSTGETDLGAGVAGRVLLLTAHLEHLCFEALVSHMPGLDKRTEKELFHGLGPLGSFSARISLAKALGLISAKEALDLHKLRKLRNQFAHSSIPLGWSHPRIKALTATFDGGRSERPSRAFVGALKAALLALQNATKPTAPPKS